MGADDLAARLHLSAIHLIRRLRREDESLGLSASQLSLVTTLVRNGSSTVGELARLEGVTPPTMSRLVQRLERDGILVRRASPEDGRVSKLRHTSKATKLLEDGRATRERALGAELEALTVRERQTLADAIDLIERLAETDSHPQ